jgi:2-oxoglutarate ferredoxin oxidoreductase subunit alpha
LARKLAVAAEVVPQPEIRRDDTGVGIISIGGCHAAVLEAIDMLREQGVAADYMRIRAFPFSRAVAEFIDAHDRCFVVEQNRDGQLRSLLAIETGIARDRMTSVLDYGGLPLTAERVVSEVTKELEGVPA